jgi:hypothetical protein
MVSHTTETGSDRCDGVTRDIDLTGQWLGDKLGNAGSGRSIQVELAGNLAI